MVVGAARACDSSIRLLAHGPGSKERVGSTSELQTLKPAPDLFPKRLAPKGPQPLRAAESDGDQMFNHTRL